MSEDIIRMQRELDAAVVRESEYALKRARWKMWTEMGATMLGQAVASQAVILNPNIPLPEAVKLAESGFQTFMGLAERAFAEAAK